MATNLTLTLAQVAGYGLIAGSRSMSAPALFSRAAARRPERLAGTPFQVLIAPRAQQVLTVAAVGEMIGDKLKYYPTVTREDFRTKGRITDLIASGQMFRDLGLPPFNPAEDRIMLCGGPSVLVDLKQQLLDLGYVEGSLAAPGDFVLERAFVET